MNKVVNQLALLLAVIGAINWGLVGLFDMNLVHTLVGAYPMIEKAVYALVGLSGIWVAITELIGDLK